MPYLRTVFVRTLGTALISSLAVGGIACGGDDEETSERDGSIEGDNNGGTNGGGTNGGGTNGGGTAGAGETCGGFTGATCPDGYFCNVEQEVGGAGCDTADGAGICQEKPSECPTIYDPVCSCDIRTYSNTCTAHSKGDSILHEGACTAEECQMVGGRVVPNIGGPAPMCKSREIGFELAGGIEPSICCVTE